jgi:multiple sugar transport system substrate-binding protein
MSRRNVLKAGGALGLAAAATPLLSACGSSGGGGSSSGTYSMWALSDTVDMQKYFTDKFSKVNKDFKARITEVPSGQSHRAKIITSASSGNLPDILDDSMNYGSDFATYDLFEPLDLSSGYGTEHSLYERVWEWFDTGNIPGYEGDSYIFGSPYSMSVYVPTYRVDLFEQAGVSFPQTWDELVDAGKAITQAPKRYALSIPTSGDLIDEFHPYLMQAGVQYVNEDLTEALPTREEAYAAFEFYRDLVQVHKIAPAETPDRFAADPAQRLTSGQVSMTTLQTVSLDALKGVVGDRFGPGKEIFIDKFWAGPGGRGGYFNAAGLHLRKGLKNPGPAIEYMQWMLEPEQQSEIYTKFNRMPISTAAWEEFQDDPQFKICSESVEFSQRQGGYRGWKLAEFAIDTAAERVVLNGEDVKTAVDQCARDMLQALQNA